MTLRTLWRLSLFLLALVLLGVKGCSRDDAAAYNDSGVALQKIGKHTEAYQKCAKAVEIDPRDAMALWWWGIALAHMGKIGKADEKWDKAIELDPALKANLEGMRERILGEK